MNRTLLALCTALAASGTACDDGRGTPADGADLPADADGGADADSAADADADADADTGDCVPPCGPGYECFFATCVPTGADGDADADADADVPATCEPTSALGLSLLRGGGWTAEHVVDEAHDVLLEFPTYIGPNTDHLGGASLEPGAEQPVSLTVTGDPPQLYIVGASYDPGPDRTVLLGYAMRRPGDGGIGDHMELVSVALDDAGGATMTRLAPTSPPPADGVMFSWIYPEGDGTHYRAFRFAQASDRAAVAGDAVSWEPETEVTIDSPGGFDQNYVAYDPTGHRLLGYGELVVEGAPPDFTMYLDAVFYELRLAGGTAWSRRPPTGSGPARQESTFGIIPAQAMYDDTGRRVVVLQDHPYTDPWIGEMMVTGAWAFSDAGMWSTINDNLGRCCASAGWNGADDRERRRSLVLQGGGVGGVDLRPGHEGESLAIDAGIVGLDPLAATFDTTRGEILAASEGGLASMAVRDGRFVWQDADGAPTWPSSTPPGHSLAYDVAGDRVVRFAGSDPSTGGETAEVWVLDRADPTPAWSEATTGGSAPAARTWHSTIVDPVSRTLYVAGGYRLEGGSTVVDLADVAALDLASMTWRAVATLPVARSSPLLRLANGGADLFVAFGERHPTPGDPFTTTNLRDAYRIATATGAVETLAVSGDLPTVSSRALSGLDLPGGYVVVSPEPYGVDAFAATFGPGALSFARSATCEEPRGFGWGAGVVDPSTGRGYVVGDSVWQVAP
ncbi:MAG: hypothetical protein HY907_07130 [Deltaproteobacteria bacterium]|nr:hypothetical protein [Deltaproteobacteria bacterium]